MKNLTTTKDWITFILVTITFITGMTAMLIYNVQNYFIWTIYVIIWCYTEIKITKNIHLKWWAWTLITIGLTFLDTLLLKFIY